MKINYNIPALRTLNQLSKANGKAATTMERLSSGLRINRSADDAAGLAIANKMDAQVKGLQQANRNTMDGISLVQTAEGTLNEVHAMLQRMRELSVQASNGTYSEGDLEQIQQEINQLCSEINRVSVDTEFNTKSLLKGVTLKDTKFDLKKVTEGVDGVSPAPGIEAEWTIDIPNSSKDSLTTDELEKLIGTGFTLDGQTVTFYNSEDGAYNGSGIGVDIKELLDKNITDDNRSAELTKNIVNTVKDKVTNVTIVASGNQIEVKAKEAGVQGNYIEVNKVGIVDQQITLQIGANKQQTMLVTIGNMGAKALGLVGKPGQAGYSKEANVTDGADKTPTQAAVSVSNSEEAAGAITKISNAIEMVSSQRAALGAVQNRLEHTTGNLGVSEENMTSSLSRIQDADMAYEMAQYTQLNVLSQAATAMLAQANQRPQQVMQLLQR